MYGKLRCEHDRCIGREFYQQDRCIEDRILAQKWHVKLVIAIALNVHIYPQCFTKEAAATVVKYLKCVNLLGEQ